MIQRYWRIITVCILAIIVASSVFAFLQKRRGAVQGPVISSITPAIVDHQILAATQNDIAIVGQRFHHEASVKFGQLASLSTKTVSDTHLEARVPIDAMPPGWYDVLVTSPDGQFDVLRNGVGVRDKSGVVPNAHFTVTVVHNKAVVSATAGNPAETQVTIPTATFRDGVMVSSGVRSDGPSYATSLNAKWIRTNSVLDGTADTHMDQYLDAGINTIVTLTSRDPSNADQSGQNGTLSQYTHAGFPYIDRNTLKSDVRKIVDPLRTYLDAGRTIYIQSENEIADITYATDSQYWRGTIQQYLDTLDAVAEAVHESDPRFTIVLSSFTDQALETVIYAPNPNDPNYAQQLQKYNYQIDRMSTMLADPNYDAADLHFYGCPDTIAAKAQWVKDHMAAGKLWISTEDGGPMPNYCDYPVTGRYVNWDDPTELAAFENAEAAQVTERMTNCATNGGTICLWFSLFDLNGEVDDFSHLGLLTQETTPRQKAAFTAFQSYTAQNTNQAPVLAPIGNQTVTAGTTLTLTVSGSDADQNPLSYSASNLPSSASFTNQVFTWTPDNSQVGTYSNVHFTVSDGDLSGSEDITITVTKVNQSPSLQTIPDQTVTVGQTLSIPLVATDPDNDPLVYGLVTPPSGMNLDDQHNGTGTITWTPSSAQTGTTVLTVNVSDAFITTSGTVSITVSSLPPTNTNTNGNGNTNDIVNIPTNENVNIAQTNTNTSANQNQNTNATPQTPPVTTPTPGSGGAFPPSKTFYAYNRVVRAGYAVTSGNVSGDYRSEIITGTGLGLAPQVRVFSNDGTLRGQFYAYPKAFHGGVNVATCDLDGDGRDEILTAPGPGLPPLIRIFRPDGTQVLARQIWGLDGKTKTGAVVACADLNADGKAEIIVGNADGGGQVTVHLANGKRLAAFFPFGKGFRGGLTLGTVDVTGNQTPDILVSGQHDQKEIRSFAINGKRLAVTYKPFAKAPTGGIWMAGGDVFGDGRSEVVVSAGGNSSPDVILYDARTKKILRRFSAYTTSFRGGVRLAVSDIDGDGVDDIVTVPAGKNGALVHMFGGDGKPL